MAIISKTTIIDIHRQEILDIQLTWQKSFELNIEKDIILLPKKLDITLLMNLLMTVISFKKKQKLALLKNNFCIKGNKALLTLKVLLESN